jgi:hypothetical protein
LRFVAAEVVRFPRGKNGRGTGKRETLFSVGDFGGRARKVQKPQESSASVPT